MLIEASRLDKNKTIFKCDKCNKIIHYNDRVTIARNYKNKSKKVCDLCIKCYKAFNKAIGGTNE